MTCFWKGIITALGINKIKKVLDYKARHSKIAQPAKFIQALKEKNVETNDVLWEGNELSDILIKQNYHDIANFDIDKIKMGYDCSSCDPFLLLICQIFEINIQFNVDGVVVDYTNKKVKNKSYKLNFNCDLGHFWTD